MSKRTQAPAPKARQSTAQGEALGSNGKNGPSPEGAKEPRLALRAPGQHQLVPLRESQIDFLDGRRGAPNPDAEMGQQLTDQYHRATGGMVEVLKFGAMMMMLEANVSARGQIKSQRGRDAAGEGLKGWLTEHAPEVKRPTAYRFMHVAEAIAAESYAQLVGVKTAKQLALPDLVTTPAESLSPALRKKQEDLFDFVAGTSQRSWLDRFAPEKTKGGAKHAKCPHCHANLKTKDQPHCPKCGRSTGAQPLTAEEQRAALVEAFIEWANDQLADKRVAQKFFTLGDDTTNAALVATWRERADLIDAWLKTPKRRREAMTLEEVLA